MRRNRKIFKDCHDLPMRSFIKVVVDGDLDALYAEPKSLWNRNVNVKDHWEDIMAEFRLLTNDSSVTDMFFIMREYHFLRNKLEITERTVRLLYTVGYDKSLCSVLKNLGFRYRYKPQTLEQDLKLVIGNCKTLIMEINLYGDQINEIAFDHSANEISSSDYDSLTVALERFHKIPIDLSNCSVAKFVAYLNSVKDGK